MKRKLTIYLGLIALFAIVLGSCSGESNRAVVTVAAMNDANPFFSDVLEQGDTVLVNGVPYTNDDFVREDWITVTFHNTPYAVTTTSSAGLLSDYMITGYRVDWRRTDGGANVPLPYQGAMSLLVPANEFVTSSIVLVPYETKLLPFLSDINYLGPSFPDEILTIATVTFVGHEVGSETEWTFSGEISVNFADAVVKTEK